MHFEILGWAMTSYPSCCTNPARFATPAQALAELIAAYEATWLPCWSACTSKGLLRAPVRLARLLMLGALNWSVQWFDPAKPRWLIWHRSPTPPWPCS